MRTKKIIPVPTPQQETWLKENYKLYNRVHLSKHLGIKQTDLDIWLKNLGLKKRDGKAIVFTEEQKQFIKDNYQTMLYEDIAVALNLSLHSIHGYCFRHGFKKKGRDRVIPPPKKIIPYKPEAAMNRPPAIYSNRDREQVIDYYLNL